MEDSISLQIKSLVYVFHRFQISNLKPFLKISDLTDEYDFDYLSSNNHNNFNSSNTSVNQRNSINSRGVLMNDKLDRIYNVGHFKTQLLNDPYRILVDYSKNKFRSLLILSDPPNEFSEIPSLNTPNFNFLVLKPDDPAEKYVEIIVNKSGIYSEHRINNKIKVQILLRIINRQKKALDSNNANSSGFSGEFTKDDRATIIRSYVQKLAFYIQVQRIYKAALKSKERDMKNQLYKYSNDKSIQSYKSLKSERSRMILLPESTTSPIKNTNMNANTSSTGLLPNSTHHQISIMDLDDTINQNNSDYPYYSDTADSQASSSTSSVNFVKLFTPEEKHVCFEQSKMAVRIRIERERTLLLF
ncbi:hypothetical protein PMKS-002843 [Pichia membranifaciens]|uniref:Uncharacterized protein n=1 Tax=Pichia membranifaciens TaxID=4926 RepID=A0A1Q2YIQ7_9ASCO|nr:hypothetical protein PMKS-002843 [Pichia membranifaciens]